MILIKDRHLERGMPPLSSPIRGKYDTYKGSTQSQSFYEFISIFGKYDTYKGSTLLGLHLFQI